MIIFNSKRVLTRIQPKMRETCKVVKKIKIQIGMGVLPQIETQTLTRTEKPRPDPNRYTKILNGI